MNEQDQTAEIERLKAQAALDEFLMAESTRTIQEVQSQINELREALEVCYFDCKTSYIQEMVRQALAATPAESLQAHDDEVIERCAKVCEALKEVDYCVDVRQGAEAIRALKGKQNE
jgi:hypothetical protein